MNLPPSPFAKEKEALDAELRGIRSKSRPYSPRKREPVVLDRDQVNAARILGGRVSTMELAGKRYRWNDTDIRCVRLLIQGFREARKR
jgi:hypothetical protein